MDLVLVIYKKKGETPLQALNCLREERLELVNETLSYAGRLDPLAEGLMLVLIGEENKNREKYLGLDKTYITEILCGVSTDTHDLLGLVAKVELKEITLEKFTESTNSFVGKFAQKYPTFSSKTVDGVQLHELSRKGEIVDVPEHEVSLHSAEIISHKKITGKDVLENALFSVDLVGGDFRQKETKERWETALNNGNMEFGLFKIKLQVSSGFYVRQFASDLGEKLGVPALAYSIKRTKVGEWAI